MRKAWFRTTPVILTLVLGLSLGCHQQRAEQARDSDIERAGALIDNEQYTEAIEILEPHAVGAPVRVKMYLASAYAGRAGLKSLDYWETSRRYQQILADQAKIEPDAPPALSPKSLPAAAPGWMRKAIPNFNKMLREFNRVREQLSALPLITVEQRPDLERARFILSETNTEGARLFRAMLTIILMRSHFEEANELVVVMNSNKAGICAEVVGQILHNVRLSYIYTLEILADLRLAFPSKAEEINTFITRHQISDRHREQLETLANPKGRSLCQDFPALKAIP